MQNADFNDHIELIDNSGKCCVLERDYNIQSR
jgi:hypothetical protein